NMALALRDEAGFRAAFDDCAERAAGLLGADLGRVVYPGPAELDAMAQQLEGPVLSHAASFACSWAIAQQWLCWGVTPRVVLGHSLGEYVAACLAGVFSLDDALRLVVARGEILARLPPSERHAPLLEPRDLHLAPHLAAFERLVAGCALRPPSIRMVSTVTGTWLSAEQATDPAYWRRHVHDTVRFADAVSTLLASGRWAVIEAGPAATLCALIRPHPAAAGHVVIPTLPQADVRRRPLESLGDAWVAGVAIDWQRFRGDERRYRVALPTYSFDRQRHWIDAPDTSDTRDTRDVQDAPLAPASPRPVPAVPAAAPEPTAGRDAAPPRDDLERALLACFRELFLIDRIGIHDDFFALGGDSLLAMRLAASIARRLDARVGLKAIAESPTVAQLAQRIGAPGSPAEPAGSCLVRLQHGDRPLPIFFVHGGGGHALVYRELARAIDPGRTMYGFAARGIESDEPLHTSVEDMASHYLELARAVHPGGPYLLAGASFGGVVVYEMARQLTASGHAVPLCALLDAPGPGPVPEVEVGAAELLEVHLAGRGWTLPELRGLSLDEQLQRVIDAASAAGAAPPFGGLAQGRRLVGVWQNHVRLLRSYTAPPWPTGDIQFFAAAEPYRGVPSHLERAWIGRCAVRVEVVPGDHFTMVAPPHAAALGARIRSYLETRTRSIRL
ncbi:MAG TPA: thioesterase domain-containing protein, partial [Kofleriaceae bacterium]